MKHNEGLLKGLYKRSLRDHLLHIFAANPHCFFNSTHLYEILNLKESQQMNAITNCLRSMVRDRHLRFDDGHGGFCVTEIGISFFGVLRESFIRDSEDRIREKVEVDKEFLPVTKAYHRYNDRGDRCMFCGIYRMESSEKRFVWYWDKNDKIYHSAPRCRRDGNYK